MRLIFFALPLLAATAALGQAQTQAPKQLPAPNAATTLPAHITLSGNCPVGMFAQQRASSQTVWTVSLEDANPLQHVDQLRPGDVGVHVELNARNKSPIGNVELEVYFVAPGNRVLPVADATSPADLKKTFHLSVGSGAGLKLAGDLLVGPAAGITRVHLLSIDYADGTSWRANSDNACSVEPSRFVLVNAR
jgi:hypothetical protein